MCKLVYTFGDGSVPALPCDRPSTTLPANVIGMVTSHKNLFRGLAQR